MAEPIDFPRIGASLYHSPWLILPEVLDSLISQFQDYDRPALTNIHLRADDPTRKRHAPQVEVVGSVAVVPVKGILGKHLNSLAMYCGGCDVAVTREQIDNIQADNNIETVVFDISSPGGQVTGIPETAAAIEELGESRRTIAFTDTQMASAGYYLAAACGEIYAAPSAIVGSISAYMAGMDNSAEWADKGRELILARTGKYKGRGMQGKAWTEDEKRLLQEQADSAGNPFKAFVSRRRAQIAKESMEGQWFDGSEALNKGLIDGHFDRIEELVADILA